MAIGNTIGSACATQRRRLGLHRNDPVRHVARIFGGKRLLVRQIHAGRRCTTSSPWQYQIAEPGFKYNMTDIAAAIGIVQLEKASDMQRRREEIAASRIERV
jgi:dTDP-4-amino-4,6-dideoxygalactose transaminase